MKKILTFLCAAALVACGKDNKGGVSYPKIGSH